MENSKNTIVVDTTVGWFVNECQSFKEQTAKSGEVIVNNARVQELKLICKECIQPEWGSIITVAELEGMEKPQIVAGNHRYVALKLALAEGLIEEDHTLTVMYKSEMSLKDASTFCYASNHLTNKKNRKGQVIHMSTPFSTKVWYPLWSAIRTSDLYKLAGRPHCETIVMNLGADLHHNKSTSFNHMKGYELYRARRSKLVKNSTAFMEETPNIDLRRCISAMRDSFNKVAEVYTAIQETPHYSTFKSTRSISAKMAELYLSFGMAMYGGLDYAKTQKIIGKCTRLSSKAKSAKDHSFNLMSLLKQYSSSGEEYEEIFYAYHKI